MYKRIDTLKDTIPIIKKLGAKVGREITEEEIARKINMSREQFDGYLNAADKTPNQILTQIWTAYEDLIEAVQRSDSSEHFRSIINMLKHLGKAKGMHITDEEIVEKMAIPREQFEAYLNGQIETPRGVSSLFRSAWPDLYKNVGTISIVEEFLVEDDE